jgi:hypothetical protein
VGLAQQRQLAKEILIYQDVEKDGGASAVLGQDHGPLGVADLLEECRGVRPEFSDRADILGGAKTGHPAVRHGVRSHVHVDRLCPMMSPPG